MVKHNNVVPNQHFKKKWQLHVRTWFNQPARKLRRRNGAPFCGLLQHWPSWRVNGPCRCVVAAAWCCCGVLTAPCLLGIMREPAQRSQAGCTLWQQCLGLSTSTVAVRHHVCNCLKWVHGVRQPVRRRR